MVQPDVGVDLENLKGDIREAIAGAEVRDAIKAKFMQFLREAENHRYMERLDLIATGRLIRHYPAASRPPLIADQLKNKDTKKIFRVICRPKQR